MACGSCGTIEFFILVMHTPAGETPFGVISQCDDGIYMMHAMAVSYSTTLFPLLILMKGVLHGG